MSQMSRARGWALIPMLLLALCVVPVCAQGQKGGGGGGPRRAGGGGGMMYLEQTWAALCFQVKITPEQVAKLRPTFQWAWDNRTAAFQSAMKTRNFEAAGKTMATVRSTLEARIPPVLTASQKAAWKKWQDQQRSMWRHGEGGRGAKAGKK